MFDIHYHLLYGLDDGPKSLEESVALAEASLAEGVTHIVATPHSNYRYEFDPAKNRERAAQIQKALKNRITIGLGCDMHMSYDNVERAVAEPAYFSINGGRYLLVEFPDASIAPHMDETLFRLQVAGLTPIITHPERNPILVANPSRLLKWVRAGCVVQVTAASLDGRFGQRAEKYSNRWIEDGWVHFIASDAHDAQGRPPSMRDAYTFIESRFDKDTAERLCVSNPRAVFFNQNLGPQPEPMEPERTTTKRGFLTRLFGR